MQFREPRYLQIQRAHGDTAALALVTTVVGRLAATAGDTLVIRPLAFAKTASGSWRADRFGAATVKVMHDSSVDLAVRRFSKRRTLIGTTVAVVTVVAIFLSQPLDFQPPSSPR